MTKLDDVILEVAVKEKQMKPILDNQLKIVKRIDGKITWFEDKIKELEIEKQHELRKMNDLLELALTGTHTLKDGYGVKPDNRRKITIKDVGLFMKWLKLNKTSTEVFDFFKDGIKIGSLKKFCDKEINLQRINGELSPTIDGIDFGEITYRRLTTFNKK